MGREDSVRLSKRFRAVAALALAVALFVPLLATTQAASSSGSTGEEAVIVGLKPGAGGITPAALGTYVGSLIGGQQPTFVYQSVFHGFAAKLTSAQISSLRRNPNVTFVEPDYTVHTTDIPTGVQRIEAPQNSADAANYTSPPGTKAVNADIAILDSGIGPNSDLNVVGGVTCTSSRFRTSCGSGGADDNGHGTHVAGTVAGEGINGFPYGVAPGARLWAVKVLDSNGNGAISTIVAGLDWIAQHSSTIEVVNMSFGCDCQSSALDSALNTAASDGLVLVAAAGNNSQNVSNFSPANNAHVIAVSAVADYDGQPGGKANPTCANFGADDSLASFSNFGSGVSIAAPGVCIESTWPNNQTAVLSGTSMASPHVAGAAALYIATYGTARSANRWSTVRNGIISNWSVPQSSPCSFSDSKSSEPLLLLAPCSSGTTPPSTGTISGTVTDASTHAGINNATITVQPANKTTTTNSSGSYSISNVPTGSQTVSVTASGYNGQSQSVTVSANTTTTQNFSLTAVSTTGSVSGTITDATTGNAISGASVSAGGQNTTTAGNGSYTLNNVPSGNQTVSVTATNYASGGGSVTVNAGQTTSGANFSLTPNPGTISGTVTDSSNHPLQGATVAIPGNSTTTNSSGGYTLSNVPAETSLSVTASLNGYNSQSKSVTVSPGGSATASFSLTAVTTSATGTLTGRVTGPSGSSVSGASVRITSLNLSTTTNSSGVYSFSSVPAGNYSVTASGPWYDNTRTANVTITGGQTTTQNFALGWWFQP